MSFHKNLPARHDCCRACRAWQPTTYPPATTAIGHVGRGNLQPSRGFTVMELLVVMAIMGILYTVVMSSVGDSRAKGRDSKRIADISLTQLILEKYYDEYSKYPNSLGVGGLHDYDSSVPKEDTQGVAYKYNCIDSCQSYHLGATLELSNGILDDDTIDADNGVGFAGADTAGCGGGTGKCYDVIPKF